MKQMKEQSAVEFLTIYGFMFVIIGVTITIIAFVAYTTNGYIPQQCSGLTGLNCQFVIYYSNSLQANAIITMQLTNSQSVPINISNITVSVRNFTFNGTCSPQFINPSGWTVCTIQGPYTPTLGSQIQGSYIIRAKYCNSPISNLNQTSCNFEKVSYVGTFMTTASKLSTTTTSSTSTTSTASTTSSTSTTTTSTSTSTTTTAPYVYCVGGNTGSAVNNVYYAPISTTGVGSWAATTNYPVNINDFVCSTSNGYVYCVGGYTGSSYLSTVYYAPISSTGVGTWTSTTAYPLASGYYSTNACSASNGYIYCVAGYTPGASITTVYYAPISSTGVGTWTSTSSYPLNVYVHTCSISNGYIYCVAGGIYTGGNDNLVSNVYYAPISSTGVGTWTSTSSYLVTDYGQSCSISSGYIYCYGGDAAGSYTTAVYYAPISSTGVGAWSSTAAYPLALFNSQCSISNGYFYCIAGHGNTNAVYYAPISSTGVGTWTASTSYPLSIYSHSCNIG
ncbi:MAG: hypothetical protein KGH69_02810 [Candidatus Micrarchaeota archaeon]|nr:hypothetical protein [Candidatus Micrarchaeota archaeon]